MKSRSKFKTISLNRPPNHRVDTNPATCIEYRYPIKVFTMCGTGQVTLVGRRRLAPDSNRDVDFNQLSQIVFIDTIDAITRVWFRASQKYLKWLMKQNKQNK